MVAAIAPVANAGEDSDNVRKGPVPEEMFFDGFEDKKVYPDLLVIDQGVSMSSLIPDQAFSIDATVRNQGDAASAATVLHYYRSSDNIINTLDTPLGTDDVPELAAETDSAQSLDTTAPAAEGDFWVGACVDTVEGELDMENQCSIAVQISVKAPDLVVINPAVSKNDLTTIEAFTIDATVKNQGETDSSASSLRYYISSDDNITTADAPLGEDDIPGLAVDSDSVQNLATVAPSGDGMFWIGACVAAVPGELDTSNQCSSGVQITLTALPDMDGDRLPDSSETNTGIFVDLYDTGTDPNVADTDGDRLNDGDEVLGTRNLLDLPALGVNPLRQDILMEYDWFDDNVDSHRCAPHTHRPTSVSMASTSTAFANSPISNPGGVSGVNLINDYGQGGAFTGGNLIFDANGVISGGVSGSEYKAYKAAHFAANRHGYFHYVLLPHRYGTNSTSSGQAEINGDDMIVSLYCSGTNKNVANTILHELGHNLSLRHGGNVNCNYKPNYNSVMNYKYQFSGVDNNCTPPGDAVNDYSSGDHISLNENNLDENNGICGPGFPWDWDGDKTIEGSVAFNINLYNDELSNCGSTLSTLNDHNDWDSLYFGGIGDSDGSSRAPVEIITEQPVPAEYSNGSD